MVLKRFSSEDKTGDSLPWVNEYLDSSGQEGDVFLVKKVARTSRGLIVETSHFKGFLFKDSTMYNFLLEALSEWVKNSTYNYPLFAIAERGGKIDLAVDDSGLPVVWTGSEKSRFWEQRIPKDSTSGAEEKIANPLLPNPPLTTRSGKGKRQSDTTSSNEIAL